MSDKNLVSLAGDGSGVVWMTRNGAPAVLLFTADEPGVHEVRLGDLYANAGQGIADVLKLSGVTRLRVYVDALDARNAAEDAIDINHCTDVEVNVLDAWAGLKYVATIKGASAAVRIVIARLNSHGKETDFDLGNFSDQGNGKTTRVSLNINSPQPVAVRLLSADTPTLENGGSQAYTVRQMNQGWFYPLYNFLKDLLAFFRIKI